MMEREASIENALEENGFYVSTTVGMSMWPMLRNRRDRVVLIPVGKERLRRLDLPMYRRDDGKYVLHRIIGVKDGHYVIRGDNTYRKEYVREDQLIGVVSEFYRGERHVRADARRYRVYAAFWHFIFPMRWLLFKMRRVASRIKHTLFK